jgi:hypothetical protein
MIHAYFNLELHARLPWHLLLVGYCKTYQTGFEFWHFLVSG